MGAGNRRRQFCGVPELAQQYNSRITGIYGTVLTNAFLNATYTIGKLYKRSCLTEALYNIAIVGLHRTDNHTRTTVSTALLKTEVGYPSDGKTHRNSAKLGLGIADSDASKYAK